MSYLSYFLFCWSMPYLEPVCRPFWEAIIWLSFLPLTISLLIILSHYLDYRWQEKERLLREEWAKQINHEEIEKRKWPGYEADPDAPPTLSHKGNVYIPPQ